MTKQEKKDLKDLFNTFGNRIENIEKLLKEFDNVLVSYGKRLNDIDAKIKPTEIKPIDVGTQLPNDNGKNIQLLLKSNNKEWKFNLII